MASHWEVAEPQGEGMEGAEVRPEVWPELWLEPDMEGAEVQRKAEVPLTGHSVGNFVENINSLTWEGLIADQVVYIKWI